MRSEDSSKSEAQESTIEDLVRLYLQHVYRVLRRAGVREADCDDVTQEVFLVVARRLDSIGAGKERAYCAGVAVRKASEYRRALARRPQLVQTTIPDKASAAPTPEESAASQSQLRTLDKLLAQLNEDQRTAFILIDVEELSFEEAASALGVPSGTISSRLHRARSALAALLKTSEGKELGHDY